MKILLYEAATAGDLQAFTGASQSILCEGYAMAEALASDLQAAGHKVTVLVGGESAPAPSCLDAGGVNHVETSTDPKRVLGREAALHDATYVIAPESGGMLAELVGMVEELCGPEASLNHSSSTVRRASDKLLIHERLRSRGMAVPRTHALSSPGLGDSALEHIALGFPLVLKPSSGAGCEGLTMVFDENDLEEGVRRRAQGEAVSLLVQEYVRGVPASVSLLCSSTAVRPLSLNRQILRLDRQPGRSEYLGGVVPLDHAARPQAFQAACEAAKVLGLRRGYAGIDMVLAPDGPVIVDVNPRLTTSYLGLRRTSSVNVAEWLVKSCLGDELPAAVEQHGYSIFLKVTCCPAGPEGLNPPFLGPREASCALAVAHGGTLTEAAVDLRDVRSRLTAPATGGGLLG